MASPEEAPPGIECRFVNVWRNRPIIKPRGLLIHTNGASVESSLAAQLRWANSASDTTKPHYVVDRKGAAWKTLPSNRKGIANYLADAFFLSIETTDLGWPTPGGTVGFSPEQAETCARIVAWESELWDFPIETPTRWDGTGVASHTDPFTYPYWTKYAGKACPGPAKKAEVRSIILPRARAIRSGEDDMTPIEPASLWDTRPDQGGVGPIQPGQGIPIHIGHGATTRAFLRIEAINPTGPGYLTLGPWGDKPATSAVVYQPSVAVTQFGAPYLLDGGGFVGVWCDGAAVDFRLSVLAVG